MNLKSNIILYHAKCSDGFSAAWAAWKSFGNNASYIGITHSSPPLKVRDKKIYLLDISYKESGLKSLLKQGNFITLIDHHISNQKILKFVSNSFFNINHSGAYLAWRYFNKKPVPKLISYVEDYDLWKFRLPYARELSFYIRSNEQNFRVWDKLEIEFKNKRLREKIVTYGRSINNFEMREVKDLAEGAELVKFYGHKILSVNSPLFVDDLCHILALKHPPFSLAWHKRGSLVKVNLRSIKGFDVSKLAQRFGGGGHKEAAGFSFPANKKFPWKSVKK